MTSREGPRVATVAPCRSSKTRDGRYTIRKRRQMLGGDALEKPILGLLILGVFAPAGFAQSPQGQTDEPVANPARPTVSNPATLTPVGYLQFESGILSATHSSEFS